MSIKIDFVFFHRCTLQKCHFFFLNFSTCNPVAFVWEILCSCCLFKITFYHLVLLLEPIFVHLAFVWPNVHLALHQPGDIYPSKFDGHPLFVPFGQSASVNVELSAAKTSAFSLSTTSGCSDAILVLSDGS